VTASLDTLVAKEIIALLEKLQQNMGMTYIMITHDLSIVRAISSRVAVMKAGRVVRMGERSQVFSPPFDPYTRSLLEAVPEMRRDWLGQIIDKRQLAATEQP